VPILETLYTWMQKQYTLAQPRSSFAKALYYCIHNWERLTQYVTDGELAIDNNVSEREMKYIAMGEKAWLFFGSDQGGENHAIVLSILSTCRRHGVEPWAYLTDVIQRLAENPDENLEDLLPYNWKVKYPQRTPAEIMASLPTPKVA
ncbi:MAG: transposase, partial [Candidatus Melainabacteria bacterium]|nr:transposase [Candidatus Melainabacteria bacterium]